MAFNFAPSYTGSSYISVQFNGGFGSRKSMMHFNVCLRIVSLQEKATEERVQRLKQRFMSAYDVTADGKLQIEEVLQYTISVSKIAPSFTSFPSY